jgi:putative transcriptional regulator
MTAAHVSATGASAAGTSAFKHPSDETFLRHAAGRLGAGLRMVMNVHLSGCPHCREKSRQFDTLGGALLDGLPPAPLSPALLERVFARIDSERASPAPPPRPAVTADGYALPAAMAGCAIGPWRFVHPRLRWARVDVPGGSKDRVILLKIAAGFSAPAHAHGGLELTQLLYGGFSDVRGLYAPGDLIEADEDVFDHEPRVADDGECLCLAAVERPLRINSFLGRLFQPLMGI